jgi:hypothetical protein
MIHNQSQTSDLTLLPQARHKACASMHWKLLTSWGTKEFLRTQVQHILHAPMHPSPRVLCLVLPCHQAGTWYMDRKNEVPAGKENYYVLPIVNWHEVGAPASLATLTTGSLLGCHWSG